MKVNDILLGEKQVKMSLRAICEDMEILEQVLKDRKVRVECY